MEDLFEMFGAETNAATAPLSPLSIPANQNSPGDDPFADLFAPVPSNDTVPVVAVDTTDDPFADLFAAVPSVPATEAVPVVAVKCHVETTEALATSPPVEAGSPDSEDLPESPGSSPPSSPGVTDNKKKKKTKKKKKR